MLHLNEAWQCEKASVSHSALKTGRRQKEEEEEKFEEDMGQCVCVW